MHYILWPALLAFGVSAVAADTCSPPTGNVCDKSILACCDTNFRKALSIDTKCNSQPVYENPICNQREIEQIFYGQGVDGVLQVCDAFNEFRDCLGTTTRSCTTYPWHLENGQLAFIAQFAQGTYTQLMFQCGSGLDAFIQNEQCILSAYTKNRKALEDCSDQFGRDIFQDPKDSCSYLASFSGCYDKAFSDGCNLEAGWWGCEINRLYAATFFPQCANTCTKTFDINSVPGGN